MEIIRYDDFEEVVYQETLTNGMNVIYIPKNEFSKTYCSITAKFGSIHLNGENRSYPAGIAHFLEHKMFDLDGGDATEKFAELGANVNAYTTFDRTCYYFTTTDNVTDTVKLLIRMVETLEITPESVEKEHGIIQEEIKMYQDMPDAEIFFKVMHNLFQTHPLSNDIAGSLESIKAIDYDTLLDCYNEFYHPSNLVMVVAGNIDVERISNCVKETQSHTNQKEVCSKEIPYDELVRKQYEELPLVESMPKLLTAYKQSPTFYEEAYEQTRLALTIYMEALFGASSDTLETLKKMHLINDSFHYSMYIEPNYAVILIGGDTNDPNGLLSQVKEIVHKGITEEEFEHIKHKMVGSFIRLFNSVEAEASEYVSFQLADTNLFDVLHILKQITFEDVKRCQMFFDDEYSATVVMK